MSPFEIETAAFLDHEIDEQRPRIGNWPTEGISYRRQQLASG